MEPRYLGDAVYVSPWLMCGDGLKLTTGSHKEEDSEDTIYLEDTIALKLLEYLKQWDAERRQENGKAE